jgi:ABC-type multidrug transport system fused ATPase/permease subunit
MFKGIVFFIKNGWKYDKLYIIWRLLFQFINALIPIAAVIIPKYMIDELMGAQNIGKLVLYVLALAGYTLIATCLSNYWNWDAFSRRCRVSAEFDSDLHRRLAEADFERLEDPHFLDMQEKAKKFLYCDWHGFGYLLDCAMMIIGQGFTLIGISAVIITLDWKIVAIFIISLMISTKLEGMQKKKAIRLSQEISRDQRGWQYYSGLFEDFSYGKEIRMNSMGNWLLSRERSFFTKVNSNLKQQNDTYIKAGNWGALFTFLQQIIAYGYLIVCIVEGTISIGSFTMYTSAVTTFASSFRCVMESIIEIRAYDTYYDDLDEYLAVPKKLRQGKSPLKITGKDQIEFKNVSFRYPGTDQYALKNINICIYSGEKLSIVGENGAGKTTFVKLLTRLYDPTEGEILFNGVNIKKIEYEQYMSLFSTVYQDYKLFSFSLKDNIALNLPVDEKKIQTVLERVGLSEKLRTLPKGMDTMLYKNFAEDGFEPSGGEGQKIALARALYRDAPFVILDEPTAAWDPRAEHKMYRNFNEIVAGKTAVYISHRMSSTKFCDKVAVFEKGRIVEYGTHNDLMKKDGLYKELFDMQAEYYKEQ